MISWRAILLLFPAAILFGGAACAAVEANHVVATPETVAAEATLPATNAASDELQPANELAAAPPVTKKPQPTNTPSNHPTNHPTEIPGPVANPPVYAPFDPALPAPPTAVPTPVPLLQRGDEVDLFALLGNDISANKGGRTDSIVLAAVNREAKTITLLSIPRDLYAAIPGWTMQRVNLAYAHGGEAGSELFKETVAYNLGLPVDHTLRVGFSGFKQIVDALGGIELVVNCPVEDWRLKSAGLDPQVEENWEQFELGYGIQQMDGDLALWYARSRRGSSDFDRGRRQQKILRALGRKIGASDANLAQLPALVQALWPVVDTDLSLGEALGLAALAPQLDGYSLHSLLLPREAVRPWQVPISGEAVQLLDWETAEPTLQSLLAGPALHTAASKPIRIAIQSDDFVLYRQVAENLAWYGFEAVYGGVPDQAVEETAVTYYGPSLKGAYADRLAWIFQRETADIRLRPQSEQEDADYRVILAPDYNPCLDYLAGPPGSEQ